MKSLITILFILTVGCNYMGSKSNEQYDYPELDISTSNMRSTVEYLTQINHARNYLNIDALDNTASYLRQKFTEYGLETEVQEFDAGGKVYKNIIASLNRDKPSRVIIGAHYDVYGNLPGADDNASAVAGLLEIARVLNKHCQNSKYRFDFVAYTLEEPPFFRSEKMGSYIHAKSLYDSNIDVRGMICLEMIGYFTEEERSQEYPLSLMKLFYPGKGDFIGIVGNYGSGSLISDVKKHMKTTEIKVESLKSTSLLTGIDFSDHRNYWEFGYKAVMVTDTSFYRNPNYHQKTDTIDTLDFYKMKEVIKGVSRALVNIQ